MLRFVSSCAILLIIFVGASGSTRWHATQRDFEDESATWVEYEWDSGAGNREKLRVTNVSVREYDRLPATNESRWQYLEAKGSKLLFRAEESRLLLYELDSRSNDSAIENRANLSVDGSILTFGVARLEGRGRDGREHALVVLCVHAKGATWLRWYRLADASYSFLLFWSWPVQKSARDIKFVERERSGEPLLLLLLLNEDDGRCIDVYGLAIDFSTDAFHFWLRQRIAAEEAFGMEVCSGYGTTVLAVRAATQVVLYEYQNFAKESLFRELQTIKSNDLKNSVCFESGYLKFLATSGPEAALFHYEDGEFKFSGESAAGFDVSEIRWVETVKLDTYRDERLVLAQLGNGTVIGLAWQGLAFERVQLPSRVLDSIDLSAVTPLPNYGFVVANRLVRIRGELSSAKHPMRYTTERLLALQRLLHDSLNHQQKILEETEARLRRSYLTGQPITGFWNVSLANATSAAISDKVIYRAVAIGAANLTREDLRFDADDFADDFASELNDLEEKLRDIDGSLTSALDLDATGLRFHSAFKVYANVHVTGNLNVGDLDAFTVNKVRVDANGDSAEEPDHDSYAIKGKREFDRVDGKSATIRRVNGVPLASIRFGEFAVSYPKVDFPRIRKAAVEGHLLFSAIFWNGSVDWNALTKEIAWKDKPIFVPGSTVIQGTLLSDVFEVSAVNNLLYPEEYVLSESDGSATVYGRKSFRSVLASRLENVTALNDLDFQEFVTLYKDNYPKEITFHNLTVVEDFEVDGEVAGLSLEEFRLLNETRNISSDVTFLSLNVLGNVELDALLVNKSSLDLEDLLAKSEHEVEIAGRKTFLGNVGIKSNVTISSGTINGHLLHEFATYDTDQAFPNLTSVSANFTFENATLRAFEKLERFFAERKNSSECLEKLVAFKAPITVEELSFDKLNDDVPYEEFARKLNDTLRTITVENLNSDTVLAREVTANAIGGIDFARFAESFAASNVATAQQHAYPYVIDSLETDRLNATLVNGMSLAEIARLKDTVASILDDILDGTATLESLRVAGTIEAASINGNVPERFYLRNETSTVVFNRDLSIRNLTILGWTNGFDISERVSDTVLKTDTEIPIHGYKTFRAITCHRLEATRVNGSPAKNILDPSNQQTLSDVAILNGSATVLEKFSGPGKIGDVRFYDLANRVKAIGNGSGFEFHGDVRLHDHVRVNNLYATGSIGGTEVDEFLKSVAFKNQDTLAISASKTLESSVAFNGAFLVTDTLNGIDLKRFRQKAVFVDQPFSIRSKVVLKGGAKVEKEVLVGSSLEAKSIMRVDVNELQRDVLHLDRPSFLPGIVTFARVNLRSDVTVERFNHLDANLLIPLSSEQMIAAQVLKCGNLTVDIIDIGQRVNGENFVSMQGNTLMTTGSQNLTGRFGFRALVSVRRSFNARLVNGIDPANFASATSKSSLIGNFLFESAPFFDQSVRALGYLNDVDPIGWEAVAVRRSNSFRQIVSGGWTVVGNVYLEKGASGSDVLNGTKVAEVSSGLASSRFEMDAELSEKNANLDSLAEDLGELRRYAEKQIYRFDALDYLQLIEFNGSIASVHWFEREDLDYLMFSYRTCEMHAYLFSGRKFELVGSVADFGVVERWTSFRQNRTVYFLTWGRSACGRSPVNLWKLDRDEFQHVLSLGRDVDAEKLGKHAFPMLLGARSSAEVDQQLDKYVSLLASDSVDDRGVKMIFRQDPMPLPGKRAAYQTGGDRGNATRAPSYVRSLQTLRFQAGPLEKEMLLYYDDELSKDRVFICSDHAKRKRILQTVKAHRPTDFAILRFAGSIDTLLVFMENRKNLRIYEYRGIQGFAYLDSIRIDADKLFVFKIRKHANLAKRSCLALVRDNRLTIFEAKMHGERVDIEAENR